MKSASGDSLREMVLTQYLAKFYKHTQTLELRADALVQI